jgi:hypothetical protein
VAYSVLDASGVVVHQRYNRDGVLIHSNRLIIVDRIVRLRASGQPHRHARVPCPPVQRPSGNTRITSDQAFVPALALPFVLPSCYSLARLRLGPSWLRPLVSRPR